MPWRRGRAQGKAGRDKGLRSHSTSCARKQHQCRAAPRQHSCLQPLKEGLVGIRAHERNRSLPREDLHGWISRSLERRCQRLALSGARSTFKLKEKLLEKHAIEPHLFHCGSSTSSLQELVYRVPFVALEEDLVLCGRVADALGHHSFVRGVVIAPRQCPVSGAFVQDVPGDGSQTAWHPASGSNRHSRWIRSSPDRIDLSSGDGPGLRVDRLPRDPRPNASRVRQAWALL